MTTKGKTLLTFGSVTGFVGHSTGPVGGGGSGEVRVPGPTFRNLGRVPIGEEDLGEGSGGRSTRVCSRRVTPGSAGAGKVGRVVGLGGEGDAVDRPKGVPVQLTTYYKE